jgi:hypothetical protein
MKKFIKSIALLIPAAMLASCSMFELDNYDGPNAMVNGKLLDALTGEKIGIEAAASQTFSWATWSMVTSVSYGSLVVIEQDYVPPTWEGDPSEYHAEEDQDWLVRFDGQFTNNLVFAAKYKYSTKKLPCYEPEEGKNEFTLKEGKNRINIGLVPFCRIKDPKIEYKGGKMVATFYVELSDPTRADKVTNVVFAANTQLFVGSSNMNLAKDHASAKAQNVTPGELITLEIDPTKPDVADLFKYESQDRYFRIGAQAEGNGYNSSGKYYNFSPTYKVSADFKTIEEVVWEENEW